MRPFKVGDRVKCDRFGQGVVKAIDTMLLYPVKVEFKGTKLSFTMGGLCIIGNDQDLRLELDEHSPPDGRGDSLPEVELTETEDRAQARVIKEMERLIKLRVLTERNNPPESPYTPMIERMERLINRVAQLNEELNMVAKELSTKCFIYKTVSKPPLENEKRVHERWDEFYYHLTNLQAKWVEDMEDFQGEKKKS